MSAPAVPLSTVDEIARSVPDGAMVALPGDSTRSVAMAVTRALVQRGARDLHLVCVPTSGLQAELLIGGGCVRVVETSAITLGEFNPAHQFSAAIRSSRIEIRDSTCPAVHAALQAGQKGIPFIPLRGLVGSDIQKQRRDWKVIDNPFQPGDPIVLLPAINPDVTLFHASIADRHGNVWIGKRRELMTMAHAARDTFVTVEEIVDENLLEDPAMVAGVIPAIYVTRIALAPKGAWPLSLSGRYPQDEPALRRYMELGRTREGFDRFVAEWDAPALVSA